MKDGRQNIQTNEHNRCSVDYYDTVIVNGKTYDLSSSGYFGGVDVYLHE